LSIEQTQASKGLKRYYWLTFVISGMVAGFLGCLVYSHLKKGDHSFLSAAAGNPKTDNPIMQTALIDEQPVPLSAFLGIEITSVDTVIAQQLGLPKFCGVLVSSVVANSPAERAGLQRGDCLLSLNNIAVENVDGFREIMAKLNPGDDVRIIYTRDGQKDTVYATLANSSVATAKADDENSLDWGVVLSTITPRLRNDLRIPANIDGIVIVSVTPGGLADEAGLQAGDIITGVDNTEVSNMNDFFEAIQAGDDNIALLDIYSKGHLRFVALDSSAVAVVAQQKKPSLAEKIISIFTDDDNVILTEHINEEDDYEKPVCKRLEESGERYEDND